MEQICLFRITVWFNPISRTLAVPPLKCPHSMRNNKHGRDKQRPEPCEEENLAVQD
jgi:hypothetical protein